MLSGQRLAAWNPHEANRRIKIPVIQVLDTALEVTLCSTSRRMLLTLGMRRLPRCSHGSTAERRKARWPRLRCPVAPGCLDEGRVEVDGMPDNRGIGDRFLGLRRLQLLAEDDFTSSIVALCGDHPLPFGDKLRAMQLAAR